MGGMDGSRSASLPLGTFSVSHVQLNQGSWSARSFSHNQKINKKAKKEKMKHHSTGAQGNLEE